MPTSHILPGKKSGRTYSSEFTLLKKVSCNIPQKKVSYDMSQSKISEWLPKKGQVYQEDMPTVALCKPKLLPLKSVTLEKMEKMQREAQEQVKEQDKQERLNAEEDFSQYS
ncbi:BBSome-interacting protein 1 [Aplysia californica]|uniref:BBSome-interacting protein 1 n=1 Tax=Aplysia californica TaxID=6500 RepID=A0ABM0JA85_APLCA|nr:BBSome-interacting protein 1 [Aplysia californica]